MSYDVGIVGGGIVGLATAHALLESDPELKIAVLEKENGPGKHQTGHNSGVIHSGIYYKPGSLKAQNCLNGYRLLLEFADRYAIPYELCGKIIVASNESELTQLDMIHQRGIENGLTNLRLLNGEEISEFEPHCAGVRALAVPQTGIIDYGQVCNKLVDLITEKGSEFVSNFKVISTNRSKEGWLIKAQSRAEVRCAQLVNCAGLYSDKVASLSHPDLDTRIIPFRGEYFMLKPQAKHLVKNLIYPVPDPNFPFLGVHFTRMINGNIEAGPNAVLAFRREGYQKLDIHPVELWESLSWPGFRKVAARYWKTGLGEMYRSFSKKAFTKALQKLIPEIEIHHLETAESGVRAQACDRTGGLLDDFKIVEENKAIHILNAPSPAATSSLSIGRSVSELVLKQLNNSHA
ncbi:MAG: L-2-hydroxyglutarate oxidase [Flavobacteriales bacterium]|nr:L-2-hydroxyglutarate oxidase [Flavobacteriales bacterium]